MSIQHNSPLPLHLDLIWVGQLELELAVTRMVVVITSYCFRTSSTTLDESLERVDQILEFSKLLVDLHLIHMVSCMTCIQNKLQYI